MSLSTDRSEWNLLFPDNKADYGSSRLVSSLEKIDDDLDKNGVTLVKLAADNPDNDMERLQIDELPAIVFYDNKFPTTFKGTERSPCDFFGFPSLRES